jgi:hypothetical protein
VFGHNNASGGTHCGTQSFPGPARSLAHSGRHGGRGEGSGARRNIALEASRVLAGCVVPACRSREVVATPTPGGASDRICRLTSRKNCAKNLKGKIGARTNGSISDLAPCSPIFCPWLIGRVGNQARALLRRTESGLRGPATLFPLLGYIGELKRVWRACQCSAKGER